jgi:hypothetical protein
MFRLFFADNSASPFTIPWAAIRPSGRNSTPVPLFVDPSMRLVITKCWGKVSRYEVAHSLTSQARIRISSLIFVKWWIFLSFETEPGLP